MLEYKHKSRQERLWEIIVGQSLVALLIILITLYLVFLGLGYKINWAAKTISHTGILYLSFSPHDAEVTVSGEDGNRRSPYSSSLLPGNYDVNVSKEGYVTWKQSVKVVADRVVSYKNIVLFKSQPEIQIVADDSTISTISAPYDSLVQNPKGDLSFTDYEIWVGEKLVSRFSTKIHHVIWYPGSEYIAFQQDDEIRVIESDGSNDTRLVKLSSSEPTNFLFSWDGSTLLYKDGSEYKKAVIN